MQYAAPPPGVLRTIYRATSAPTLAPMEVLPSQSEVFLVEDTERQLAPGGPALVASDGSRREIPPRVFEAIEFLEAAMRQGFAVQITALRTELPKCSPSRSTTRMTIRRPRTVSYIRCPTPDEPFWTPTYSAAALDRRTAQGDGASG